MAKKSTETTAVIEVKPIKLNTVTLTIEGDSDLILNKMNDVSSRKLMDERKNKGKTIEKSNEWEEVITAVHWRDGQPKEFSKETLKEALKNNAPCITAFGVKKSLEEAVVRNELDKKGTKLRNGVNVIANGGLIPVRFAEHYVDEKLMQPRRGKPVLARQNRFTGWSADVTIQFVEGGAYSLEQIVQIVNLAGFGGGIGSGRTSGYGRYHVSGMRDGF